MHGLNDPPQIKQIKEEICLQFEADAKPERKPPFPVNCNADPARVLPTESSPK